MAYAFKARWTGSTRTLKRVANTGGEAEEDELIFEFSFKQSHNMQYHLEICK